MSEQAAAPMGAEVSPNTSAEPTQESQSAVTAQKAPEFWEKKINGKMVRMTAAERDEYASIGYSADDKFKTAAQKERRVDEILSRAKSNPFEQLRELGLSRDELRAAMDSYYYQEFIEPESLSEEQLKNREYKKKLETYEAQEKQRQQDQEKAEDERLSNHHRENYSAQIVDVVGKTILPHTPKTASRVALAMRHSLENGWEAPPEYLARAVEKETISEVRHIMDASPIEKAIQILGDDFIHKLRAHDLKQLRESRNRNNGRQQDDSVEAGSGKDYFGKKRIYYNQVNENLRKIKLGKY